MLATPNDFLVLYAPGYGFQNYLLHHLLSDQSEADWPIIPWVLLLEQMSDICFLPVFGHLSQVAKTDQKNIKENKDGT